VRACVRARAAPRQVPSATRVLRRNQGPRLAIFGQTCGRGPDIRARDRQELARTELLPSANPVSMLGLTLAAVIVLSTEVQASIQSTTETTETDERLSALSAPHNTTCAWGKRVAGHYLDGWCQSLAPDGKEFCGTLRNGTIVPSSWPYDTSKLDAAQAWCCQHVSQQASTHVTSCMYSLGWDTRSNSQRCAVGAG
jgi:hypothetical protein